MGGVSAKIDIFNESCCHIVHEVLGEWTGIEGNLDMYEFTFSPAVLGVGLYFCRPCIWTGSEAYFGHGSLMGMRYDISPDTESLFQISVVDFQYDAPSALYGGVIYHLFVDRFMRGGDTPLTKGGELVAGEWDTVPEYPEYPGAFLRNNTFYGGTLWGVIDKLEYIKSLGVTAIYLSPIFESVSNHRYDTADYMTVDKMLGGDEALRALIDAAGKQGIKIILDGVFNHTGDDSIYFNRRSRYQALGAYQSRQSEYFSWFDFKEYPNKYTCWWDIEILPRINPDIPACREYFVGEEGVIAKYRRMGVYGFRLDVADELSDGFIADIKSRLSEGGESMLLGEVWEDASNKIAYNMRKRYYLGSELDGVMNYPLRTGLINYITNRDCSALRYALTEVIFNAPERIMHAQMNLLGTHDTERILTVLGGSPHRGQPNSTLVSAKLSEDERITAVERLMSAYTVLATLPGVPAIFYGDEAGLEGYSDPFNRLPYPWGRENEKLLDRYVKLGRIRRNNGVYKKGEFRLLYLSDSYLAFARYGSRSALVTLFNNTDKPVRLTFSDSAPALIADNSSREHILAPYSAEIYKTGKNSAIQIIG